MKGLLLRHPLALASGLLLGALGVVVIADQVHRSPPVACMANQQTCELGVGARWERLPSGTRLIKSCIAGKCATNPLVCEDTPCGRVAVYGITRELPEGFETGNRVPVRFVFLDQDRRAIASWSGAPEVKRDPPEPTVCDPPCFIAIADLGTIHRGDG